MHFGSLQCRGHWALVVGSWPCIWVLPRVPCVWGAHWAPLAGPTKVIIHQNLLHQSVSRRTCLRFCCCLSDAQHHPPSSYHLCYRGDDGDHSVGDSDCDDVVDLLHARLSTRQPLCSCVEPSNVHMACAASLKSKAWPAPTLCRGARARPCRRKGHCTPYART